ncbi:MAG: hypothetical protein ACRC33_09080 [Gemmataceae bacterium]
MDLPFVYGAALGVLLGVGVWHTARLAGQARDRLLRRRVARLLRAARRSCEGG